MKINLLEPKVFNRISAGEVVERPASIVKELIENSIDAGATIITVSIVDGGIRSIEIADNGSGIEKEDMFLAFTPHATSKIKDIDDLDNIASLGFRGEALASISSVCHVHMTTKTATSEIGYSIKVDGGVMSEITEVARTKGTTLTCNDLFFNTPARAKFLRKPKTEESEVTHLIEKFMLSNPHIAFCYNVDGKQVYNTTPSVMQDIIYTIYGKDVYNNLIPVDLEENGIRVTGFVTKPKLSKSNRTWQTLFVNGRYVENYLVSQAVQGVYESFLMKGRFPIYVLSLTTPFDSVDVNVHPSKREVKFENNNAIFGLVRRAVEKALLSVDQIATFVSTTSDDEEFDTKAASSPYNEKGFNPVIKPKDKVSDFGGRSFGHVDVEYRKFSPNDFKLPVQETTIQVNDDMPDFANVKLDKSRQENKLGGPFFFDQQKSNTMADIIEEKGNSFLKADIKEEMNILGTIFKTYIVAEYDDKLYFLDQHAAHERLLYDKLLASVNDNKLTKQPLLAPYTFTLGLKEQQSLEDSLAQLSQLGFEISQKGGKYEVTAVPLVLSGINLAGFVDELIKEGIHLEHQKSSFIHDKLCQSACKHAIKGGDTISKADCAYIIEQVRKGVMLCPHGRPIAIEMSRREFEKLFKRIV